MREILEIRMFEPWVECWACGAEAPHRWGLPVNTCGELASNDYEGEWGGVPACRECFEAHAEGRLTADNLAAWQRRRELERRAMQAAFARG